MSEDEQGTPGALEIPREALDGLSRHAVEVYPEECCGFLVGAAGPGGVRVSRVMRAVNEASEDRRRRFLIAPERVLAALRRARSLGAEIVGYYHSHPDHPPVPSTTDRESAWPGMSYLIVPVTAGAVGEARSWRLAGDGSGFVEELVAVAEASVPADVEPRRAEAVA